MRRLLIAAILAAGMAAAQAPADERLITVLGEGQVEVVPDMATVRLGVVTEARGAREAIETNSRSMAGVIDRLESLGIGERDIQTSGFSVSPRWRRDSTGAQEPVGFVARNVLRVRIRDLDRLGEVLDAVARDGANSFDSLQFGLAEPQAAHDAARRRAIADAKGKAALYVDVAGAALGPVQSISETGGGPAPMPMARAEMAMASDAVPVAPGELSISARVWVTYAIIDAE